MARVLINHCSPIPNKITGISIYTWSIVEALVEHGVNEYVLLTNWDLDKLPASIKSLGMQMLHRDIPRNETAVSVQSSFELPSIKRKAGCNAMFHPQPTTMLTGLDDSVVVVHDLYRVTHAHLFNWKQRTQWDQIVARGLRGANQLIAVSDATRQATVAAYPDVSGRISVVHEASPISAPATPIAASSDAPYALMVANITPNKNVQLLIEALKLLADRGRHLPVRLVGRDEFGVLPGLLAGRNDLKLTEVGTANDETLRREYAGAKVYVNTSLVEGFCLPILEAQTYGLPVICSELPVLREVAGDGAVFVPTDRPEQLADALVRVFDDHAFWASLQNRGLENVKRFSWEKAARETEAIINKAVR